MHQLTELIGPEDGLSCVTRIWVSEKADDAIKAKRCPDALLLKLERSAIRGLRHSEGTDLRHEGGQVWRFGIRVSNFRLIGFYMDDVAKTEFVIIDAFVKKGKKNTKHERDRIREVMRVREQRLYMRRSSQNERT